MYLVLKNRKHNTSQLRKERISFSQLTPCAIEIIYSNINVTFLQVASKPDLSNSKNHLTHDQYWQ